MLSEKAGAVSAGATAGPAVAGPEALRTAGAAAVVLGRKMSRTRGGGSPVPRTRRSLRTSGLGALGREEAQGSAEGEDHRDRRSFRCHSILPASF
jgi:hypothetical protein